MSRSEAGFSMVELMVVIVILLVAALGLIAALLSAVALSETTRETALASQAVRGKIEELQETAFPTIFDTYKANPGFDVKGLIPLDGDPDGRVGEILFPVSQADSSLLDESAVDADLGMPRDLNGDKDATDLLSSGYLILPVRVKIEWKTKAGARAFSLVTCLAER